MQIILLFIVRIWRMLKNKVLYMMSKFSMLFISEVLKQYYAKHPGEVQSMD